MDHRGAPAVLAPGDDAIPVPTSSPHPCMDGPGTGIVAGIIGAIESKIARQRTVVSSTPVRFVMKFLQESKIALEVEAIHDHLAMQDAIGRSLTEEIDETLPLAASFIQDFDVGSSKFAGAFDMEVTPTDFGAASVV